MSKLTCPFCDSMGTLETRRTYYPSTTAIRRYRRCTNCYGKVTTEETFVKGVAHKTPRDEALNSLLKWGVNATNAEKLVDKFSAKHILNYSRNLFGLMLEYESQHGRPVKDPAAYLVYCIKTGEPIPKREQEQIVVVGGEGKGLFKLVNKDGKDWIF